jgi:hypothetical protein
MPAFRVDRDTAPIVPAPITAADVMRSSVGSDIVDPGRRAFHQRTVTQRARGIAVDEPLNAVVLGNATVERRRTCAHRCTPAPVSGNAAFAVLRANAVIASDQARRPCDHTRRRPAPRLLARGCFAAASGHRLRTVDEGFRDSFAGNGSPARITLSAPSIPSSRQRWVPPAPGESQLDLGQAEPRILLDDAIVTAGATRDRRRAQRPRSRR